ncbi:predicted protein [Nematostella vectensis]|uniref:Transmembrane protein 180 n=1 Tax=Nematostella vectensis TaxID=45351 RepID=A7SMV0_NEMVE|nr:transmembrane protein 180 [Nematostella vectensis]EDO34958.1 predicted protein [Nematostella vectensis]|eukprot:XP_001627058.1 predicted protein [Nematostella vectensis]
MTLELCVAYGSLSLFIAIVHNVFLLYYVQIFVSVYRIDQTSFWIGEAVFLVWNSVNDPLFGWLSDHKYVASSNKYGVSSPEIVRKRFRALTRYGPLFAVTFLLFWFQWAPAGLQFVVCLCLYDAFLTIVDLNHLALLADLALSATDRTRLNGYCSVFSAAGCISVFVSYYIWDSRNVGSFQVYCCVLSAFSLCGFLGSSLLLSKHLLSKKMKVDTPVEESGKSLGIYIMSPSQCCMPLKKQELELKTYIHQLKGHKNFLWFAAMNLVQVFHCHFNSNFFPLFLDKLLGNAISPRTGALLLGVSFVVPHINNLYFLTLCRKYGVYTVIKWLFYVKLLLGLSMMSCGPNLTLLVCFYIASNRVFTEGTCKLLNLVISDLVDEDFVLNNRSEAISALVFGTSALLSKPGQTLAPLIGTWLLSEQTGTSIFYASTDGGKAASTNFYSSDGQSIRWGCFCVLVYVSIGCAVVQILLWSRFNLHGKKLEQIKHMREGRGFTSLNV